MSRLEAQEMAAGLYYPTPEPVITALAHYLRLPKRYAPSFRQCRVLARRH